MQTTNANLNRQSPKQLLTNRNFTVWSKLAVAQHWLHKSWQENQRLACALMLLPASLLLSACAGQPTRPCEPLPQVSKLALQYPLPPVSYSLTAQQDIARWQSLLTNTSSTFAPSLTAPKKD